MFDVKNEKISIKLEHVNQPDQNCFKILGIPEPFQQGGSWRITLPKRYVKKYDIPWKCKRKKYFGLVFVETANGVLLVEIDEIINPETLRKVLEIVSLHPVGEIYGVIKPFQQGGSWRITLPKRYVKKYDIPWKCKRKKYFGLVFVETANGVLLVEIDEIINPETVHSKVYCVLR